MGGRRGVRRDRGKGVRWEGGVRRDRRKRGEGGGQNNV